MDIKILKHDYFDWVSQHTQVDLEERYVKKIREYIKQFGYSDSDVSIKSQWCNGDYNESRIMIDVTYDTTYHSGH